MSFVKKKASQIHAIILDIMLPPGKAYEDKDTNEGLRTGVLLLPDLRRHCPGVPVVVLTNVKNPDTLREFKEGPLLKLIKKTECPPFELVAVVEKMVGRQEDKSNSGER